MLCWNAGCAASAALTKGSTTVGVALLDTADLYGLHRVDPTVPLAESWSALAELRDEGRAVTMSSSGAARARRRPTRVRRPGEGSPVAARVAGVGLHTEVGDEHAPGVLVGTGNSVFNGVAHAL